MALNRCTPQRHRLYTALQKQTATAAWNDENQIPAAQIAHSVRASTRCSRDSNYTHLILQAKMSIRALATRHTTLHKVKREMAALSQYGGSLCVTKALSIKNSRIPTRSTVPLLTWTLLLVNLTYLQVSFPAVGFHPLDQKEHLQSQPYASRWAQEWCATMVRAVPAKDAG